ncbi:MAG: hypothetical protein ACYDDF_14455 [Thermoplasmatota archaeon]
MPDLGRFVAWEVHEHYDVPPAYAAAWLMDVPEGAGPGPHATRSLVVWRDGARRWRVEFPTRPVLGKLIGLHEAHEEGAGARVSVTVTSDATGPSRALLRGLGRVVPVMVRIAAGTMRRRMEADFREGLSPWPASVTGLRPA